MILESLFSVAFIIIPSMLAFLQWMHSVNTFIELFTIIPKILISFLAMDLTIFLPVNCYGWGWIWTWVSLVLIQIHNCYALLIQTSN